MGGVDVQGWSDGLVETEGSLFGLKLAIRRWMLEDGKAGKHDLVGGSLEALPMLLCVRVCVVEGNRQAHFAGLACWEECARWGPSGTVHQDIEGDGQRPFISRRATSRSQGDGVCGEVGDISTVNIDFGGESG